MKSFSELLEEYRKIQQISKRDLAIRAGLTPGYISHLTRGERTAPSKEAVYALADSLELDTKARKLLLEAAGYSSIVNTPFQSVSENPINQYSKDRQIVSISREDWGDIPNVQVFYGRLKELAELKRWMIDDHCQMVAVLGIGGIGKTLLTAKLAEQIHFEFDYIIWRSLRDAPPAENILKDSIQFFYRQQAKELPEDVGRQLALLLTFLQEHRCLVVLDNFESILQEGQHVGQYKAGYESYGQLLRLLGEAKHQSSLLLTSREKPKEVATLEGSTLPIRSMQLLGVAELEGKDLLKDKGLSGSDHDWSDLIRLYSGNPLALKLISEPIREVFGGNIANFIKEGEAVLGDIHDLLDQQFQRLPNLEQEIMYWLAINREAISVDELREDMVGPVLKGEFFVALGSLRRRSMIESISNGRFALQPVILEYVTERFVEQVVKEINVEWLQLFVRHALIKAQTKDYVRNSQMRFILAPVADRLLTIYGRDGCEKKLRNILSKLQETQPHQPGYSAGNLINLLVKLKSDFHDYDFSHLVVRQAYLQGVSIPYVNFSYADLATTVFTDTFGSILSIAFSPCRELLAAGTANGEIRLWQINSGRPILTYRGHADWVWSVAFSPDGKILASGSQDQTIRLWDVATGNCLNVLQGHSSGVGSIAFSPDGKILASGGEDQTIRLWDVATGDSLNVLQGHTNGVRSVTFSPDGKILASGNDDQTIRLWDVATGELLNILQGHTYWVRSVVFNPSGTMLASGSWDQTIRLWDVATGELLNILQGHTNRVESVAFSPDGSILASGCEDQTVRLWDVATGNCLNVLQGHTNGVGAVTFSPDGTMLASGSEDQTIRLWDITTRNCLSILQGYTNWIGSISFSPDGKILASGSQDQMIRLWDVATGELLNTFQGHTNWVWSVTFSPDGKILASGGDDQTIRLWDVATGELLNTFQGHTNGVGAVAFSPDGKILASGSWDQTIRLWDVATGELLNTFQGHTNGVRSVVFNPSGTMLASGSQDQTIRLWDVATGELLNILQGHTNRVESVAFSPDGSILASGCEDQTVRLWDVATGNCLNVLQGHTNRVESVTFSPDGTILASGSHDRTVRLWDVATRNCLSILREHTEWVRSVAFSPDGKTLASSGYDGTIKLWDVLKYEYLLTLRGDRPYEGMKISHVKGLTAAQKASLKTLGAIENT